MFTLCGSKDIKEVFLTEYDLVDQLTGQELWGWGWNSNGTLGNNAITSRSSPVQTVAGGTNWKQASVGIDTFCATAAAIKTDGTLWVWGSPGTLLGTNSTIARSSPVQTVSGGTNWKQVAAGKFWTVAIKTDGTLWTWGLNTNGQLGTNSTIARSSPVQTVSGGTNWKQVSVGDVHTAAIKTDGTLWLWGTGSLGRIGDNVDVNRSSPVQTVAGGTNWKQVAAGFNHTAAIKTDGTLWTWGGNNSLLGDGTATFRSSPVQTISGGTNWKQVSAGGNTAAIKTDGTLWIWGNNDCGSLGINSTVPQISSPVQTAAGGNNWKQASSGFQHTAAIKTDGTLWIWGGANCGALGTNSTAVFISSPVQTVAGGTNWRQVGASVCATIALKITE